ncbi:lipocalin family protein [Christiangramia aestuarii]
MIKSFKMKCLALIAIVFLGLVGCSKDEAGADPQLKVSDAMAVTNADMIGHWQLSRMMADTLVDLDDDNSFSKNLLDETDCFNTMSITFKKDGTFISNNAQMSFEAGASQNEFSCLSDRMDSGNWEVRNDSLILEMQINGETYIHRKLINFESDRFSFDVNKIESNQYVNDPGDTQASAIRILELEYSRK